MKELISVVQENFQDTLKKWVSRTTGFTVRKIEVKNVVKIKEVGRKERIDQYEVLFSSEGGLHSYVIGVKQFKTIFDATKEANGSFLLQEMIKHDNKVFSPVLQYFSYEFKTIIYDYPVNGTEFLSTEIDEPRRFYLAGRSLPHVHGLQGFNQIDVDHYLTRIKTLVKSIQKSYQSSGKLFEHLSDFFKEESIRWRVSMGGGRKYGHFSQDSLFYEKTPVAIGKSGDRKIDHAKLWLLHPAGIKNETIFDRFEDFGSFLLEPMYEDFCQHSNLDRTTNDLVLMINGYNSVLVSVFGIQMFELYKEGLPINQQIILKCLEELEAADSHEMQEEDLEKRKEFLQYLMDTPFEY
ncbi:MAG: hypothetical protein ACXAEU_07490 [Candidatus Hodarchaeales archaeon]|jgi:hypothetical protein